MTQRIESFFDMTQRIEFFFEISLKNSRIELLSWKESKNWTLFEHDSQNWFFSKIWFTALNPSVQHDSKNWILHSFQHDSQFWTLLFQHWLMEIEPTFWIWLEELNSFFFFYDSENWTLSFSNVTQKNFNTFFEYDSQSSFSNDLKNWTF